MATTVSKAVRIEVEARTEGAVRGIDKLAESTKKAQEQTAQLDTRLKASEASWQKVGERIDAARKETVSFAEASAQLGARKRETAHSLEAFSAAAVKARRDAAEPLRRSLQGMARDYDGAAKSQRGLLDGLVTKVGAFAGAAFLVTKGVQAVSEALAQYDKRIVDAAKASLMTTAELEKSGAEHDALAIAVHRTAEAQRGWTDNVLDFIFVERQMERAMRARTAQQAEVSQSMRAVFVSVDMVVEAKQALVEVDRLLAETASQRIVQIFEETSATEGLAKANEALAKQRFIDARMTDALRAKGQLQVESALDFFGLDGNRLVQGIPIAPGQTGARGGGRGGAKKDNRAFKQTANMDVGIAMMGRGGGMRDAGAIDPFDEDALAKILDFEQRKAEIVLNERLRAIETQREEGVDPVALIDAEESARLAHLEFMEGQAQSEIERLEIVDQQRQVVHDANMQRLAEERAVMAKRVDTLEAWGGAVKATGDAAVAVAKMVTSGSERAIRFEAGVKGAGALVDAAIEQGKAIAAFASLNIPQGIAHQAAVVSHIAASVEAFKLARGGSGGGGSAAGGKGTTMFGGAFGTGQAANSAPQTTKGQKDTTPLSPGEERLQQSIGSQGSGGGGTTHIYHVTAQVLGAIDEQSATKIEQGLQNARRRAGKLSA